MTRRICGCFAEVCFCTFGLVLPFSLGYYQHLLEAPEVASRKKKVAINLTRTAVGKGKGRLFENCGLTGGLRV